MPVSPYIRTLRASIGHDLLFLPGVTALIFNDAGEVLLNRRTDNGRWAVIGGVVDPGESPAESVVREVEEETGLIVAIERVSGVYLTPQIVYPNKDRVQYITIGFRCRIVSGTPRVNDDESSAVAYFALDALPADLKPDHIRRITDAAAPGTDLPAKYD